jgi:hypothetical protein
MLVLGNLQPVPLFPLLGSAMASTAAKWTCVIAQLLLTAGFISWIGIYSYKTYAGVVEHADKLPDLEPQRWRYWKELPDYVQKSFEENIAWMHLQVRRYARFKLDDLGVSPTPRVWLGEDGWLYYNHEADSKDYFALPDPRLKEYWRQWLIALPEWRVWLKERGIRLQIVIAPDKQSIYPEYLPPVERKRIGPRPLDILLDQLRQKDAELPILDLRESVRNAKAEYRLYFQTDTHWNPYGLCVGYRAAARALGFEPLPDDAIRVSSIGQKNGDLPLKMGYWRLGAEPFDNLEIIKTRTTRTEIAANEKDESLLDYLKGHLFTQADLNLPKAVLFHDSFGEGLYGELLAQHFNRLLCVPSNHLDPEVISREQPDVVILEIVERLFQGIGARRPTDPPRRSMNR